MENHSQALEQVFNMLGDTKPDVVSHRIVHGGTVFNKPSFITSKEEELIRALSDLAPLHNPPALKGLEAIRQIFPNLPQVGVFDTAFHQTIPHENHAYALPDEFCQKYGIRKY